MPETSVADRNGSAQQAKVHQYRKLAESLGFPELINIPRTGLFICAATITPATAGLILERHHIDNNRRPKLDSIDLYADDMLHERWTMTHQGLAFNEDGLLCDGQNRLHACKESGVPLFVLVTFGLPVKAICHVDTACKRTAADLAKILRIEADAHAISFIRTLAMGENKLPVNNERLLSFVEPLREPIDFIVEHFPKTRTKRVRTAATSAAVCRAFYYVDHDRLAEFCRVLGEGLIKDPKGDSAASTLRCHLENTNPAGGSIRAETFFKTQRAIERFVSREYCKKVAPWDHDIYPLPKRVVATLDL